jgi:hypothetical protein
MNRDLLARPVLSAFVWWMPQAGVVTTLYAPISIRVIVWVLVLSWTGAACIFNAVRSGRTHCHYTGPFYLMLVAPTLLAGFAEAPIAVWLALAAVILIGGKMISWLSERSWGAFC